MDLQIPQKIGPIAPLAVDRQGVLNCEPFTTLELMNMPFSWYHPDVPAEFSNAAHKAKKMCQLELGERAALLRRLGFTKTQVVARLKGNLAWDFETTGKPPVLQKEVKAIVDDVFAHRGLPGGGTPSL